MQRFTGQLVDVFQKRIYPATVTVGDGRIQEITEISATGEAYGTGEESAGYLLPGFVDAHVHIESSMLVPAQFARMAVVHGTVGTVSDPHEIANVCGVEGVTYMIANGDTVPFKFNFGAPSCVPATTFETAGATIDPAEVTRLLEMDQVKYLSEMMNFPGVLMQDEEVMKKIESAHRANKPVDGHAPGLRGEQARRYIDAGISTDHECFTREEAMEKLSYGMKILIREGSAAKNFEALADLLHDHSDRMMFCSDDKHPDSLEEGHINLLCARAVAKGIDVFKVLAAACVNPVQHYKLDIGLLRTGDPADFIVVQDLANFKVLKTFINGNLVAENGMSNIQTGTNEQNDNADAINNFHCREQTVDAFIVPVTARNDDEITLPVIEALEGQLITNRLELPAKVEAGSVVSDPDRDILKLAVINRYSESPIALSFIRNFGLKRGAIASSVAHDSHNIITVGVDDESMCRAVNLVIREKGGISCVDGSTADFKDLVLPLPVAGLMSVADGYKTAKQYTAIDAMAKSLGATLAAPFMTLSFMALLVIPHLKLSDKGLFDGDEFRLLT